MEYLCPPKIHMLKPDKDLGVTNTCPSPPSGLWPVVCPAAPGQCRPGQRANSSAIQNHPPHNSILPLPWPRWQWEGGRVSLPSDGQLLGTQAASPASSGVLGAEAPRATAGQAGFPGLRLRRNGTFSFGNNNPSWICLPCASRFRGLRNCCGCLQGSNQGCDMKQQPVSTGLTGLTAHGAAPGISGRQQRVKAMRHQVGTCACGGKDAPSACPRTPTAVT